MNIRVTVLAFLFKVENFLLVWVVCTAEDLNYENMYIKFLLDTL
jgi:hypothetical protein